MNKLLLSLFIGLISIIFSTTVSAISGEFSFSSDTDSQTMTMQNDEATLYNFSDNLVAAAENCQSYSENFTDFNPDLKEVGAIFGNTDFEILVDIKGLSEDLCKFDVTQKIMGSRIINHCSVNTDERKEIIAAMLDRSKELITETFTSYAIIEEGNNTRRTPIQNTLTDTHFNIVFSKIMGNNCQQETQEPTEEEMEKMKKEFKSLSESFQQSLAKCNPDKETKLMIFFPITVEIVGKENNLCLIKYDDFDLHIPEDRITKITSLDDLDELLNNKNIATYNQKDTYDTSNLLDIIDNCTSQTSSSSKTIGSVEIKQKRITNYQNNAPLLLKITLSETIILKNIASIAHYPKNTGQNLKNNTKI